MTRGLPLHLLVIVGMGVGIAGCSRAQQEAPPQTTANTAVVPAETKPAPVEQPVVLNGCLQEGTRGAYILTQLSEPKHPDSSKRGVVAQERADAARHAYRLLSTRETNLSKLVGEQVRIEGKETHGTDAIQPVAADPSSAPNKKADTNHRIKQDDLASVQVDSISPLGKSCGGSTHRKARAKRT
jgi:hypothetical protein